MDIRNWLDNLTNLASLIALPFVFYYYFKLTFMIKKLKRLRENV